MFYASSLKRGCARSLKRFAFRINYIANEPRVKLRHGVIVGRMRDAFATFNEHA